MAVSSPESQAAFVPLAIFTDDDKSGKSEGLRDRRAYSDTIAVDSGPSKLLQLLAVCAVYVRVPRAGVALPPRAEPLGRRGIIQHHGRAVYGADSLVLHGVDF